mgnify:CR=1 FL=1
MKKIAIVGFGFCGIIVFGNILKKISTQKSPIKIKFIIFEKDGDPRQPLVAGILITASDGQQLQISASELPIGNVISTRRRACSRVKWTKKKSHDRVKI